MQDSKHGVGRNQISSFNPAYQIRSNGDGSGDIEFDFWGARKSWYYDGFNTLDGCEIEFQVQDCVDKSSEDWSVSSPMAANDVTDACPLLSSDHFYSTLSPASRRKVIEEGRKEMMEMIRNMPESNYELSLKDLVDAQPATEEVVKGKVLSEDKSFDFGTEAQMNKQKQMTTKKKKRKAGEICRSVSRDANSFLIKMFFPCSLSLRKKSTAEHSSKVSPTPMPETSNKPVDKQWWIKRIFVRRKHKNREYSNNSINCDTSNISKSRHNRSSLPSSWNFSFSTQAKTRDRNISYMNEKLSLKLL